MRDPHYIPRTSRHRSGQAVARLNGRDHYLGAHGSPEAAAAYERLIAEWLADGRRSPADEPTVNDVILAFLDHATAYYKDGGPHGGEVGCIKDVLKIVKQLYGRTPAADFGPRALKVVRDRMIGKGWCRRYINAQVDRIQRMFRWATEEEIVPGSVHHALRAVRGIRKGTPGVRESERVRPGPAASIRVVFPHVPPAIAAMIRFQDHTGCRPEEVCRLRRCHIRQRGKVWVHEPPEHKTDHHDIERRISIGPRAQRVLGPWIDVPDDAYLFSPAGSEAHRNGDRRANRRSPMTPSQTRWGPRARRKRPSGQCDTTVSDRRAIHRACDRAKVEKWSPNQLRHTAATRLRRRHGIEAARIILGHTNLITTQVYAEADLKKAFRVMSRFG
ncbi:tyrosine-type recombinase/integrase [Tautonia sociabilis]|uniref:Recombinase XerD n=1 Tax=Tautonia sociabilis TaxID=2080755 RepID=A0A432ME48_9BACT|nr:tyrosine-type recombinase/integrase [Tautonia sociabilis]RUL83425.1 recombinase XerD [Tautonia sociabilis]